MLKDLKRLNQNNCWDCTRRNKGGINAFGVCTYFEEPKEIPSSIVDVGCKFWRDEQIEQTELF